MSVKFQNARTEKGTYELAIKPTRIIVKLVVEPAAPQRRVRRAAVAALRLAVDGRGEARSRGRRCAHAFYESVSECGHRARMDERQRVVDLNNRVVVITHLRGPAQQVAT